jgi:hypothetical protein
VRATIFNWKGYLATETCDRPTPGTCISLLLKPRVAEELRPIADAVAYWCPFPEFPIEITNAEGVSQVIDVIPTGDDSNHEHFCFPVGDQETIAVLNYESRKQDIATLPPLCQDGLAIPDVPPPILDKPEQEILRRLGIRVNLRGNDRVPLDLSRNLVKGGAGELWDQLIPKIWNGLIWNGMNHKVYRQAFSNYVQQTFEESFGKAIFSLSLSKGLEVDKVGDFVTPSAVEFLDPHDDRFFRLVRTCDRLVILPSPPLAMMYGIRTSDDMYDAEKADDPVTSYWANRSGISTSAWHDDYHDLPNKDAASLRTLTSYKKIIFEQFKYVAPGKAGTSRLTVNKLPGVCNMTHLGFFRLSLDWSAIRSPLDGEWRIIHANDSEMVIGNIPPDILKKLSFEEFVILVLHDTWPDVLSWEVGWPTNRQMGKAIFEAKEKVSLTQEDDTSDLEVDVEDNRDGDDSSVLYNDDEYELELDEPPLQLEMPERRRVQRHGVRSIDDFESLSAQFAREILPIVDTSKLQKNLTPWDREAWEVAKTTSLALPRRNRRR